MERVLCRRRLITAEQVIERLCLQDDRIVVSRIIEELIAGAEITKEALHQIALFATPEEKGKIHFVIAQQVAQILGIGAAA